MRTVPLLIAMWAGALQLPLPDSFSPDSAGGLLTAAATLAGLTVMVYRLGVWRQEMQNTKHNVGAEVTRCREETNEHLERLDRRFDALDLRIAAATEQRVASERWQARADTTIENHEREIEALGSRVDRLEVGSRLEAA